MHVNRTGSGVHRDSRKEARMSRAALERWAIEEDLDDLEHDPDCESVRIEGTPHYTPCGCARRMRGLA